jgi:hypothetical protein
MNKNYLLPFRRTATTSSISGLRIAKEGRMTPWRRLRQGLILLACMGCGFLMGIGISMEQSRKLATLKEKNARRTMAVHRVRDENDALQEQLARAQVSIDMQLGMINSLRSANEGLQKQLGTLQRDLAFYQRLAAPQGRPGIQVQSYSIAGTGERGLMQYHLILVSNRMGNDLHRGTLHIVLAGHAKTGQPMVMDLKAIDPQHRVAMDFSFRSMIDITGKWHLPPEFLPDTIAITVTEQGKKALERHFRWEVQHDARS